MERQFGPFKKGDLVRFRHQEGHKALGVVVESVEYHGMANEAETLGSIWRE